MRLMLLITFLLGLTNSWAGENAAQPSKVALLGPDLSGRPAAALALAEAALSTRDGMEVLERAAVASVVREQKLFTGGFATSDEAIQIGQLLSADIFVHVEAMPGEESVAVVAFDARRGVRLADEIVTGGDADVLSGKIVTAVEGAVGKIRRPGAEVRAVAVLSIRNVNLPPARRAEGEAIGALLERSLLGSPSVVVVERKRLQEVNRERELTLGGNLANLLASTILIEMDVQQAPQTEGLSVTAFLTDAGGSDHGKVSVTATQAAPLVAELTTQLIKSLNVSQVTTSPNPAAEAARFLRMSRFWKAHKRTDEALASAEAAYALWPGDALTEIVLIDSLFQVCAGLMPTDRPHTLALASWGMALLAEHSKHYVLGYQTTEYILAYRSCEGFVRGFGAGVCKSKLATPLSEVEAALYTDFCRDWLAWSPFSPEAKTAPSSQDLSLLVIDGLYYFADAHTGWTVLSHNLKRWADDRMAKESLNDLRDGIPWMLRAVVNGRSKGTQGLYRPMDYEVRDDLWTYFNGHSNATLRLYGSYGRIEDATREEAGQGDAIEAWRKEYGAWRDYLAAIFQGLRGEGRFKDVKPSVLSKVGLQVLNSKGRERVGSGTAWGGPFRQVLVDGAELVRSMLASGAVERDVLKWYSDLMTTAQKWGFWSSSLTAVYQSLQAPVDQAYASMADLAPYQKQALRELRDVLAAQLPSETVDPFKAVTVPARPLSTQPMPGKLMWHTAIMGDGDEVCLVSAYTSPNRFVVQAWDYGAYQSKVVGIANIVGRCTWDRDSNEGVTMMKGGWNASLGKDFLAVSLVHQGIYLFDRSSSRVEFLQTIASLPLDQARAFCLMDNQLYIAINDGYLVAYNCETRESAVLIASSRKGIQSPFDDGPPVGISCLIPDPPRKRVVFLASVTGPEGWLGAPICAMSGLWEYREDTRTFRQIFSYVHRDSYLQWSGKVDTNQYVLRLDTTMLIYNLASDTLTSVSMAEDNALTWSVRSLEKQYNLERRIATKPGETDPVNLIPPYQVVGNWLLTGEPWGRLSLRNFTWEPFPARVQSAGTTSSFWPEVGILPFGDETLLLASRSNLWLVKYGEQGLDSSQMDK